MTRPNGELKSRLPGGLSKTKNIRGERTRVTHVKSSAMPLEQFSLFNAMPTQHLAYQRGAKDSTADDHKLQDCPPLCPCTNLDKFATIYWS